MASSTIVNGVSIYNLSAARVIPNWISDKKKKELNKDSSYRRRIELLQDFIFPEASQTITISNDGRYIIATGTYPPRVRVYDTTELSMKFERYMDATPVALNILGDNYDKLAFLQDDRNIEIHAAYGKHYRTRIPRAGRCMNYHQPRAELLVGAADNEVYRLNLEKGQFLAPLVVNSTAVNKIVISRITALVGLGCEKGICEFWDPRDYKRASTLHIPTASNLTNNLSSTNKTNELSSFDITSINFEEGGMGFLVGTSDGRALLYDLRHNKPIYVRNHPYGLPVIDVRFHRNTINTIGNVHNTNNISSSSTSNTNISSETKLILSTDTKQCRIWRKDNGGLYTTIETPAPINDVAVVSDDPMVGGKDSGLLIFAGEQDKVMSYYVPSIGVAPKWASFIDSVTEELEEQDGQYNSNTTNTTNKSSNTTIFDDYKFITKDELNQLNLTHLIGTTLLKPYMHGYFMDARLYSRVRTVMEPTTAVDTWKKAKVQELIKSESGSRITLQDNLPKVNRELALRLREQQQEQYERINQRNKHNMDNNNEEDDETENNRTITKLSSSATKSSSSSAGKVNQKEKGIEDTTTSLLSDNRFSRLFTDESFSIDPEEAAIIAARRGSTLPTPSSASDKKSKKKKRRNEQMDSDMEDN